MTSAPAIGFDYRPSRLPARLLSTVGGMALLAIVLSGAPWWLKLLFTVALVAALASTLHRLSRSRITGVGMAGERWTAYCADRTELPAALASSRILGSCVLLRLKTANTVETLLLAPDNSDADLRRRLRMRLATLPSSDARAHD